MPYRVHRPPSFVSPHPAAPGAEDAPSAAARHDGHTARDESESASPFARASRDVPMHLAQHHERGAHEAHVVWGQLYGRMRPLWDALASATFLGGQQTLRLGAGRIPDLEELNRLLATRTGFSAVPVTGRMPAPEFFACLERREFPTTITLRHAALLDDHAEPDLFHDVAGHLPLHADAAFADVLARIGTCARRAGERAADAPDALTRRSRLRSMQLALVRFFSFTIELGLTTEGPRGVLKAYGGGLLSSFGELPRAVISPHVERLPFDLQRVVDEPVPLHRARRRLFIVRGLEHLQDLVHELEWWLERGRLDHVAVGAPDP